MNVVERNEFLLGSARTVGLATVRPDGRPHVALVWFDLDGDEVIFTIRHASVRARNIANDPQVSLCVDEEQPPFALVLIEGEVQAQVNDPDLRYWTTRIAGRYTGEDLAEIYGKRNGAAGELLVRVRPIKTIARKNVAG